MYKAFMHIVILMQVLIIVGRMGIGCTEIDNIHQRNGDPQITIVVMEAEAVEGGRSWQMRYCNVYV